jgi:hypothetical protein
MNKINKKPTKWAFWIRPVAAEDGLRGTARERE